MKYLSLWRYGVVAACAFGIGILVAPESQKSKDEYNLLIDQYNAMEEVAVGSLDILANIDSLMSTPVLLQMRIYDLTKKADKVQELNR